MSGLRTKDVGNQRYKFSNRLTGKIITRNGVGNIVSVNQDVAKTDNGACIGNAFDDIRFQLLDTNECLSDDHELPLDGRLPFPLT